MKDLKINLVGKGKSPLRNYLKIITGFDNITPVQLDIIEGFIEIYHKQYPLTKDPIELWGHVFSPISRKTLSKKLSKSIVNINNVIMELKKKKVILELDTHLEIRKIYLNLPKTLIFEL